MLTVYTAQQVHAALNWAAIESALAAAFAAGADVPLRHAHHLNDRDVLLLMPAWNRVAIGLKVVTVMPGSAQHGAPTVGATYLLLDRDTGVLQAVLDGDALTVRRTAAVSALAARHMARDDARTLLLVGTGHLAPWLARAHYAARPLLERVMVWGRHAARANAMAAQLRSEGVPAHAAANLEYAAREADIIACATTATTPLVQGAWLRTGTHLDLVGGFTRDMREADDATVARSRIVVDSYDGALAEAGDLVQPLERGVIARAHVVAELAELIRGEQRGRQHADDITLFKSVGTALADLAAAQLVAHRNPPVSPATVRATSP